jgi:hypothetical protein
VTCGCSVNHAACVYSLMRPLRTGFRQIFSVSRSVTAAPGNITFAGPDALGYAMVRPGRVAGMVRPFGLLLELLPLELGVSGW